ncbi:MAG: hypothetical protein U0990_09335 [Candidatus Nanopelagicales bacterium]|nr:hypothetical protein [Candidatus Nanopelagicales bacterium]
MGAVKNQLLEIAEAFLEAATDLMAEPQGALEILGSVEKAVGDLRALIGRDDCAVAPARIIVSVSGGVVQNVAGVPAGVVVEVRDYDVEGDEPIGDGIAVDEDGPHHKGEWT